MLPLILFLFFIHIICSETHSQQYDSWSIDRFIKKYTNWKPYPNWKFSLRTTQKSSPPNKNLFFNNHRIPVPYTTVFTEDIEPDSFQFAIKKGDRVEQIDSNAVVKIKTIAHTKYLSEMINDLRILLSLESVKPEDRQLTYLNLKALGEIEPDNASAYDKAIFIIQNDDPTEFTYKYPDDEDNQTYFTLIHNLKYAIKLYIWLHEHIENGVLYDNDMEIYGWLHQLIYAIEKWNVQFLYPWLIDEMYSVFSSTHFAQPVQDRICPLNNELSSDNIILNNNNAPSTIVFDDADSFYNQLGMIIFLSNTPDTLLDILPKNIVIIEKNNQKVIDFFKELVEKYNPTSTFNLEKLNVNISNDISITDRSIKIIHQMLKLITHTDETLMNNHHITIVYPFAF